MPTYLFNCNHCGCFEEIKYTFAEVNNGALEKAISCRSCPKVMVRAYQEEAMTHTVHVQRSLLKPEALSTHAEDWKKDREAKKALAIMDEGWESKSEVMDSLGMAKEREKELNKTKGSLTTGVAAAVTTEQKEAVKKRDLNKKQEAVKQRKKLGLKK